MVRRWVKLGDWDGKAKTFSYKLADLPDQKFSLAEIDRLDVLVQSGGAAQPGLMLGVATARLPQRDRALNPLSSFRATRESA